MLKRVIARNGHFIENRKKEIVIGGLLAVIGLCLLWDSFDGRGKKMPWPVSGMTPW